MSDEKKPPQVFGSLDFLPDRVARGDVRVHPTRAAERANARLAPLVEALERWSAKYKAELSIHALSPEFTAVQREYRKLVPKGET